MSNRLRDAASPYLLQHAENPVDWYPWGEAAFEKAKKENKPVLVSIGYAACHWCHVMAHESFEDEATAAYMNQHFVNIKVDREEHPDVDHLYMDALQAMSGHGGWPLNMFVTPDKKPFYGGTYFPPKPVYGRSSWMQVLEAVHEAWTERPAEVGQQADQLLAHLKQIALPEQNKDDDLQQEMMAGLTQQLLQQADKAEGGFGAAPKFPSSMAIQYLLEYAHFQKEAGLESTLSKEALAQALLSLDKMIAGGIYDQLEGGFARYATDKKWLVPHFEKMLYDNALLVAVLSDAYQITGKSVYREVIEETIAFCQKELGATDCNGFYCALDADSEAVEGKYYTWTYDEFLQALPDAHPALLSYFGISKKGNWESTNILSRAMPAEKLLAEFSLTHAAWSALLQEAKAQLLAERSKRVPPATDNKILLSWNALMNIALSKAGVALKNDGYLADAGRHIDWLLKAFKNGDGSVNRVYKNDKTYIPGKLDDYAFLIKALLTYASASGKPEYIPEAAELVKYAQAQFRDTESDFFNFSSKAQKDILVKKMDFYDNAMPSANGLMADNLSILGSLMERNDWLQQHKSMLLAMQSLVHRYPLAFSYWAVLLQHELKGQKQLIIAGPSAATFLKDWQQNFFPQIFVAVAGPENLVPAFENKRMTGHTALFLCEKFQCKSPVNSVAEVVAEIKKSA